MTPASHAGNPEFKSRRAYFCQTKPTRDGSRDFLRRTDFCSTLCPSGQGARLLSECALHAWVRIPQVSHNGVLAQSEACVLSKDEVLGSKPRYSISCLCSHGLVGYDARLTRERSRVRSSVRIFCSPRKFFARSSMRCEMDRIQTLHTTHSSPLV